jgi:hypothetical protein
LNVGNGANELVEENGSRVIDVLEMASALFEISRISRVDDVVIVELDAVLIGVDNINDWPNMLVGEIWDCPFNNELADIKQDKELCSGKLSSCERDKVGERARLIVESECWEVEFICLEKDDNAAVEVAEVDKFNVGVDSDIEESKRPIRSE